MKRNCGAVEIGLMTILVGLITFFGGNIHSYFMEKARIPQNEKVRNNIEELQGVKCKEAKENNNVELLKNCVELLETTAKVK